MIEDKPRIRTTPPGVRLCALDDIADGGARGFVLEMRAARFHGFAVRRGGDVAGYVDSCPHTGAILARRLDEYLTADRRFIVCGWHGAIFEPGDGLCVGGPCAGAALTAWPLAVADGTVVTA